MRAGGNCNPPLRVVVVKLRPTAKDGGQSRRVDQLQLRAGRPGSEHEFRPPVAPLAFDHMVAELLGERSGLVEVRAGDPTAELARAHVHEDGQHADLDALVEVLVAPRKPQTQTLGEVDVTHGYRPPLMSRYSATFWLTKT